MSNELNIEPNDKDIELEKLCTDSVELIHYARNAIVKHVNIVQIMTYYSLGRWIVETQQMGQKRAKYGSKVIKILSEKLQEEFGKGFSEDTLKNARKFYLTYKERISETVFSLFAIEKSETVFSLFEKEPPFIVSWSHYLQLMRIENEDERSFYEIESAKSGWAVRTLQRQYNSSLYERLALSRDKNGVLRLAKEGNVIEKPEDIIKQPTVLEFLGMEEKAKYSETDLETALINKLQKFLLELGKGYLFEARQKRFTYDEENFYVDLVFYNRLLRCYVLIDLKVDKLTHGAVNFLFGEVKTSEEHTNPPGVMYGSTGMIDQLVELGTNSDKLKSLVKWIFIKCNSDKDLLVQKYIREAMQHYVKDRSSIQLIGVLVRDTNPNEMDLKNRYIDLKKRINGQHNVQLLAVYSNYKMKDGAWEKLI